MNVGVIGSGSIGPDLAYGFLSALAAVPGARVHLVDINKEALDAGVLRIHGYLKKGVSRGKINPKAAKAIEAALHPTMEIGDLADCDYVLEAASENLGIKRAILDDLEKVVSAECLIGFATSGLPRAHIAAETKHPERCFVNHPFYPAWRALPIEVVLSDNAELGAKMIATLKTLGKVPIVTGDVECFAADDIFCNYISEAARIVEAGIATPAQVDRIVNDEIGGGGPFNVMDLTRGNLLTVHCQELMRDAETGTPWFEPPKSLSTQGNEPWHDRRNPDSSSFTEEQRAIVLDRILAVLFARTYFVLDNGICEATDLNWLSRFSLGFRAGLLELAADCGAEHVRDLCTRYAKDHPDFEVPKSIADGNLAKFRATVRVDRDSDIAVVSVFRPEARNALSAQVIAELDDAFTELGSDDAVKGIVFTSYDGALAGADVFGIASLTTPEQCRDICAKAHPIMRRIEKLGKPVVAAIDGPVMGGGAEFSMACHARVVGTHLALAQPEVNLGIIPGYGGTQRLPRLVGIERAAELVRTGRVIGSKDAVAWGWADESSGDPKTAAEMIIRRHLSGEKLVAPVDSAPMSAVPASLPTIDLGHRSLTIDAIVSDVMVRGLALPLDDGLALEAEGFARCKQTVDMDIGIKNFIQNGPRVPASFLHE